MNMFAGNSPAVAAEADWSDAPLLTEEKLTGTFWRLGSLENGTLSPFIVLAPEGRVGNFSDASVEYWHVLNGRLCLVGSNGLPTAIFNVARNDGNKLTDLAGRGNVGGINAIYVLTATDHPEQPAAHENAGVERKATFLLKADKPLRPNLVVVPANAKTLHGHWLEGLADDKRNWDLCVGFYGEERPFLPAPAEYLAHLPKTPKFKLLHDLFYEDSPLWGYDRIWLPDDDLLVSGQDINLMFHLSRKHGLDLCQPSLVNGPGSYPTHPVTFQRPEGGVRHERFIEIMCPLFSRRALQICIGSFKDTKSGYGLDHLWPSFLGRPYSRMAMLDDIGVKHTRPIATNYNLGSALDEQKTMFGTYNFTMERIAGVK